MWHQKIEWGFGGKYMKNTKESWNRLLAALTAVMLGFVSVEAIGISSGMSQVYAVDFTVTNTTAVLYTVEGAKVYTQPDLNSQLVTVIAKDLPVDVTGITSNGWFQISLKGTYYMPGTALVSKVLDSSNTVVPTTDITSLTKGTFTFYKNPELSEFDKNDVADMDDNEYIKYMDSFLMGYSMLEYCILKDSGKFLKEVYDSEAKVDKNVAAMSMQAYLINYRNIYFSNSLAGPFRNEKDVKLALNRAIRYEIPKFGLVYRSTSIGSDEKEMKKFMEGVVNDIKAEQGVTFTCTMKYGDYKLKNGEGKGWTIEFTKKD